jgi:sugar phosphate permease
MALVVASLLLFTRAPVGGSYVEHLLPVMVLLGFGIGVSFPALMSIAMSGATQADAGLASGLVNTSAQVGGAIGLAVLATLSTTRTDDLIASGEDTASALTSGFHLAFVLGAGLVLASIGIAIAVIEAVRAPEQQPGTGEPEPASSEA